MSFFEKESIMEGENLSQTNKNTFERVYEIVKQIPVGKVTTYGQIARLLGNPHLSQVVGFALHSNPSQSTIPCHRVVNRFGGLAEAFVFGGINEQNELLKKEGILFLENGNVDLSKHMWYEPMIQRLD